MRIVVAVAVLLAVAASLVLPPIENKQLADALAYLREPVAAVAAAVLLVVIARVSIWALSTVFLVVCIFAGVQTWSYFHSTAPGREAREASASWRIVPPAPEPVGEESNTPNELGSATLRWRGNDFNLHLRTNVGTSQQGIYLPAGDWSGSFHFSARVEAVQSTPAAACPLMFGIVDRRTYFMFYVAQDAPHQFVAKVVQRWPLPTEFGFDGRDYRKTNPLPSVNYWNILQPWQAESHELAIRAKGNEYWFYVNDRLVYETTLEDSPPFQVSIGAVAVTNDEATDVMCHFKDVRLAVS